MRAAPLEDHDDQPKGFWTRFKEKLGFGDYYDEDEIEFVEDAGGRRRGSPVKLGPSRLNHVSVWLTVQSFDNAQQAADGLKLGHQQIVNLEKATPDMCTRVIDFLSGVTYALDGYVEKVGERVYMFTPANYVIEVENGEKGRRVQGPFREN
ncbi:MAG: cell division protein SepF [Armatimonadota bacterium]|nr:cell division protein SepF [Armatimonadota bacterium]